MRGMASTHATNGVQNTPVAVKQEPADQVTSALNVKQEIDSQNLSWEIEGIDQQIPTVSDDNFFTFNYSKISKITFNLDDLIVVDNDKPDSSLENQVNREFDSYLQLCNEEQIPRISIFSKLLKVCN